MAEERNFQRATGDFREAVCIDGGRVYDSCCDRDCLEDLRCYFSPQDQSIINSAVNVRCRCAEIINVYIDVEPVHLNRGYYSCDLTFYFLVNVDVYTPTCCQPIPLRGVATFSKKVILYGSEGRVRVFSNEFSSNDSPDMQSRPMNNMPKCVVECVDPVPLGARICEIRECCECCAIPRSVCDYIGGEIAFSQLGERTVFVTLGLFTIVQLIRNVQMLIPVYDFCIPEKECEHSISTDNPCEVFSKLKFPTNDFFPPRESDIDNNDPLACFKC